MAFMRKNVTARTEHACDMCGKSIRPGQRYWRTPYKDGGSIKVLREHMTSPGCAFADEQHAQFLREMAALRAENEVPFEIIPAPGEKRRVVVRRASTASTTATSAADPAPDATDSAASALAGDVMQRDVP